MQASDGKLQLGDPVSWWRAGHTGKRRARCACDARNGAQFAPRRRPLHQRSERERALPKPLRRVRGSIGRAWHRLAPPAGWLLPVVLLVGISAGLLALVVRISNAHSYLSDNPATCVNCHVMAPQYATWANSRHRLAATCNDCHVPHDNPVRHYAFKASDGARHAFMFTFRLEPQVIRIHAAGQRVVQENCVRCHGAAVHMTRLDEARGDDARADEGMRCWACHRETPHGRVRGLAAVPYEHIPLPGPTTPPWLRDLMRRTPAILQQD